MRRIVLTLAALAASSSCGPAPAQAPPTRSTDVEATSLLGRPLIRPPLSAQALERMEGQLAEARSASDGAPDDADATIWLGRRTAYLGRYREAIRIFTDGIERHADDARLYRHRGHRLITVRQLDDAIADLERAAALLEGQPDQIEPDGQPNARNIPTSTLRSNTWYHLALARYLQGDFSGAAEGWQRARDAVDNPDNLVAASAWLCLALMRAGRTSEASAVLAPIDANLDVIENGSYQSLLLLYRGERTVDDLLEQAGEGASGSAVRYGIGAWHLISGRDADAVRVWNGIIDGSDWPSFGFIAAEAEIARRGG